MPLPREFKNFIDTYFKQYMANMKKGGALKAFGRLTPLLSLAALATLHHRGKETKKLRERVYQHLIDKGYDPGTAKTITKDLFRGNWKRRLAILSFVAGLIGKKPVKFIAYPTSIFLSTYKPYSPAVKKSYMYGFDLEDVLNPGAKKAPSQKSGFKQLFGRLLAQELETQLNAGKGKRKKRKRT